MSAEETARLMRENGDTWEAAAFLRSAEFVTARCEDDDPEWLEELHEQAHRDLLAKMRCCAG